MKFFKKDNLRRVKNIIRILSKEYPNPKVALNYDGVFQLLVAVILSAQCTDVRVNRITPALFERFPDARAMAGCDSAELERLIYTTGFYRNKAKNIKGAAVRIVENFGGEVPSTMEALLTLPGVARKTANVILSSGFGKNEGIVVDTHVIRISGRLDLASAKACKAKNAASIEKELMKIVPKEDWGVFSHYLVFHGRNICVARKPRCADCGIRDFCPGAFLSG